MNEPDFYLTSHECDPHFDLATIRRCWRIKRLKGSDELECLLVKVSPPLQGKEYIHDKKLAESLEMIVLSPRLEGYSLFPVLEIGRASCRERV